MAHAAIAMRAARWRLRRDVWFVVATVASIAVAGVLVALAGAWSLKVELFSAPFRDPGSLWFVQIGTDNPFFRESGPEHQVSARAVSRFAAEQHAFDGLTVAQLQWVAVEAKDGGSAGSQLLPGLSVDPKFWDVLGVAPALGRIPLADAAQVVIGDKLARALFGTAQLAIGKQVVVEGAASEVVGVLSPDFVAPSLLSEQRQYNAPISLIRSSSVAAGDQAGAGQAAAVPFLIIGRSASSPADLASASNGLVAALAAEGGESGWRAVVTPLVEHMLGNDAVMAVRLLVSAIVLALTALGGVVLLALSRFNARGADIQMLEMIGASPGQRGQFERVEAALIAMLTAVVGPALLVLLLVGLHFGVETTGIVDRPYLILAALILLAMVLVGFGMLRLAAQAATIGTGLQDVRNARGGAKSALAVPSMRVIQGIQALVVLVVMSVIWMLLDQAIRAFQGAQSLDVAGVVEWRIEFPEGVPSVLAAQEMTRIRSELLLQPAVLRAAISLVPALDLRPGQHPLSDYLSIAYSGPRDAGKVLSALPDGGYITQSDDDSPAGMDSVQYSIATPHVDPEFFSVMGYRLLHGRIFEAEEPNAVVLTEEAAHGLFPGHSSVVGESIPGPAWQSGRYWNNGLRVVGVVRSASVTDANLSAPVPWLRQTTAFLPYQSAAWSNPESAHSMFLVMRLADASASHAFLDRMLESSSMPGIRGQATRLDDEVWRRLQGHMIGVFGSVLIAACVLLAALISAAGGVRLILDRRRAELGVRLAVGANELALSLWLYRREILLPILLAAGWLLFCMFAEAAGLGASLGLGAASVLHAGAVAALVLLAAISVGFFFGVRPLLRSSPMEAMRAE